MSDEQSKPVRSREEQAKVLISRINDMTMDYPSREIPLALAEAEARGAAEQRRKDGEGQEAVYQVYRGDYYGWFDCKKSEWEEDERDPEHKRILYTCPANVAALEGRIAELEGALSSVREAIEFCDPAVLGCTMWMPGSPPETVVDFISSTLKPEGTPS